MAVEDGATRSSLGDAMGVSFYGTRVDGTTVNVPFEHPTFMQLSNANARAFLMFLGLGDTLCGEVSLPEARRAVIRARATFDRRVRAFTREVTDIKRPGQARVVTGGIDSDYFGARLDGFERLIVFLSEREAIRLCWA
jgi:hypothetical protein